VRVIGVIDLLNGKAVHARAGARQSYTAVTMAAGVPIDGDAVALARTYLDCLGLGELYIADLDAITAGRLQESIIADVVRLGAPVWLDAGVFSAARARAARALGAKRIIVGLETLPSFDVVAEICVAIGGDDVALSLDLRDGQPVVCGSMQTGAPEDIAWRAAAAGVGAVIVLDLARVGMRRGLDRDLISRVRRAVSGVVLLVGGGIRGDEDLASAAGLGCDGALVATALHDGLIHVSARR
jgi:phosphoribosylformimino-5-aminoimidazole carboxamide ribotide isomerase